MLSTCGDNPCFFNSSEITVTIGSSWPVTAEILTSEVTFSRSSLSDWERPAPWKSTRQTSAIRRIVFMTAENHITDAGSQCSDGNFLTNGGRRRHLSFPQQLT